MSEVDQNKDIRTLQHTRRHITKAGVVVVAALLATFAKPKRAVGSGPLCFLKGTKIRTAAADRKVEDLIIGDLLLTVSGEMRPIQWIGRYEYKKSNRTKAWVKNVRPVHIVSSALDRNVPEADLFLTQAHALYIDDVLVPVDALINGTTIQLDDARKFDELEYFHIKLENHDVIYAEGTPCETLSMVTESANNFGDYVHQYGTPKVDYTPYAPILGYHGGRSELKSHLRSALSPWVDRRQKLDIIRDRLEERGIALCWHKALMP